MIPPPLPASTLTQILSHLLPPSLPLPTSLLSRSLLQRHLYLPPDPDDLDAHLTAIPSTNQDISTRLNELTRGYNVGEVEYGFDGEFHLARVLISSDVAVTGNEEERLEVIFEFEEGDDARGWVYRSTSLVANDGLSAVQWSNQPSEPSDPTASSSAEKDEVEDYWAGFTPTTTSVPLPSTGIGGEEEEDGYWAQYGKGGETPGVGGTPNLGNEMVDRFSEVEISNQGGEENEDEDEDKAGPSTGVLGFGDGKKDKGSDDGLLRQKISATISNQVRKTWSGYSKDANGRTEILEERGLEWLRIGRDITGLSSGNEVIEGEEEKVVRGKLEILLEMHLVLEGVGGKEGFWRLLEEVIKLPRTGEEDDRTQERYWE